MRRRVVGFFRAPELAGEAALVSLVNVAVVLGVCLAWGKVPTFTLLMAAGVGTVTRLSDLYLIRLWRQRPVGDESDLAA
jgi:hypothetical protein